MNKKRKGWTSITLPQLFTAPQLEEIHKILNTSEDREEATRRLVTMFSFLKEQLNEKHADPMFLAYAVAYNLYKPTPPPDDHYEFSNN